MNKPKKARRRFRYIESGTRYRKPDPKPNGGMPDVIHIAGPTIFVGTNEQYEKAKKLGLIGLMFK